MKVIFSHGFGVQADARGLFTEIIAAFPQHEFITFDYNTVFDNGDVEIPSLPDQAHKLQSIIAAQGDDKNIIIAHSQGCLVASLIDLKNVSKIILLAPPTKMSVQRVIDKLKAREGSIVNLKGISKLPRRDGTTTLIPKEYLESIKKIHPMEVYQKIANSVDTTIVRCTADEVLGLTTINEIKNAGHKDISSDHDFTGDARQELINYLRDTL